MGGGLSNCVPSALTNVNTRRFFENMLQIVNNSPDTSLKNNRKFTKMIKNIYSSLRRVPAQVEEFSLLVSGDGFGPLYLTAFYPLLIFPQNLTKVSFRKASLKKSHVPALATILKKCQSIEEFDVSENDFGDDCHRIIISAIGHLSIESFLIESCGVNEVSYRFLLALINTSRNLKVLRCSPANFSASSVYSLKMALHSNLYLTYANISAQVETATLSMCNRNGFINEIVDSIARFPFQTNYRERLDTFKSVKGRQMLDGKARQIEQERCKGTVLYDQFLAVENRAKMTENVLETVQQNGALFYGRVGRAETIGRRQQMEDVSIIVQASPIKEAVTFAIFDGHGGRDAAEYAAQTLPTTIKKKFDEFQIPLQIGIQTANYENSKFDKIVEEALIAAFREQQNEMKPWCVYFGTTVALAIVIESPNFSEDKSNSNGNDSTSPTVKNNSNNNSTSNNNNINNDSNNYCDDNFKNNNNSINNDINSKNDSQKSGNNGIANYRKLFVASIGDTRCVLCREGKAVRLTIDHKPEMPEETEYIQKKGGIVKDGRVGGMLAISRALGDSFLGECINATPSVKSLDILEQDAFMIIACDGVWDAMSDQEAVDLIATEIDPLAAAKKIRDRAFELESTDNISVIVAFFSHDSAQTNKE